MHTVCVGEHGPPAVVDMLLLIGLKSTDESCIYSILLFVCQQAKQLGVERVLRLISHGGNKLLIYLGKQILILS